MVSGSCIKLLGLCRKVAIAMPQIGTFEKNSIHYRLNMLLSSLQGDLNLKVFHSYFKPDSHIQDRYIHVNVWQKPLQYCKVIRLNLIKINEKKKGTNNTYLSKVNFMSSIMKYFTFFKQETGLSKIGCHETNILIEHIHFYSWPCLRETLNSITQANIKDKICAFIFFS